MSDTVLISTAEFVLKSEPVRQLLMRLLKRHLRFNLKRIGLEGSDIRPAGGFLVLGEFENAEPVAKDLSRTLGVAHADACERTDADLDNIVEHVARLAEKRIKQDETFAVRARNFEPTHLKGKEIEIRAGAEILSRLHNGIRVNLGNPDSTLRVFYGREDAFVSAIRFDGIGGLPVGSQGSVLGMATDPALSPLSFFLMMKRGAMVWPVIAILPDLPGEASLQKILGGLKMLKTFVPRKTYHAYRIEPDQDTLRALDTVDSSLRGTLSVRLAFRSIAHLARIRGALGLTVADCFGHAGPQKLGDLRMVDEVTRIPIYRPLLMLDSDTLNRQLADLELLKLAKEREEEMTIHLPDSSMKRLRELEDSIHADHLAQRIAGSYTKILIQ